MSNFRLASNRNQISAIDFIQLGSTANKLAAYTKSKKVKRLEASLPEKPIFRFFWFFWVGFRFISVFEKPTSVSVFKKTAVSVRFSVNRLKTSLYGKINIAGSFLFLLKIQQWRLVLF
jgi:hypothetical protein